MAAVCSCGGRNIDRITLQGSLPLPTLAWEEVSIGRAGTSALWGRDMTASAAAAFSAAECSDLQLESSAMPHFSKSLTSTIRLILGFQGVLGVVAAGIACAPPSGRVVHSGSSGESRGMSILICGYSSVVMLELLCSGSGRVMVTGWSPPFKPTG